MGEKSVRLFSCVFRLVQCCCLLKNKTSRICTVAVFFLKIIVFCRVSYCSIVVRFQFLFSPTNVLLLFSLFTSLLSSPSSSSVSSITCFHQQPVCVVHHEIHVNIDFVKKKCLSNIEFTQNNTNNEQSDRCSNSIGM